MPEAPDCNRCRHHFITYEPTHPHGCRAFGMKSRELPAAVVRASSGHDCEAYEEREGRGPEPRS